MASYRPGGHSRRRSCRPQVRGPATFEPVEPRTLLTTYYVSPAGSDSNSGTSTSAPFKTIAKVNTLDFNAGDSVLFQGGQTFAAPTANKATDPGFESGNLNSWTENLDATSGNSTVTSTSSDVHSGSKALRVSGGTTGGRGQFLTSTLKRSTPYVLSFWAKISSGTGAAYGGISFYDSTGAQVGITSFTVTGSSYARYGASFVTPALFSSCDLWFEKTGGTSVAWADDFNVVEANTIVLTAQDSGTAASPVTIGSYGNGRATINDADGSALLATDVAGLLIDNINFTGTWNGVSGTGTNVSDGLVFVSDLPNNGKVDSLRVRNVDVSHFKWQGISVRGRNAKAGFTNVNISYATVHDNGDAGITCDAIFDSTSTLYAHSNLYVGWCQVYNNGGIANKGSHSGNGIVIGDVSGGTIERCVAHDNGALCNSTAGGPVGIWAWDSDKFAIQYNESYHNQTGSVSLDGGGFDLDGGVTNSLVQYNYSHDNDGAGYLLYQFSGARPYGHNTVRYNISQNDGRQGHYAGIYLGGGSDVAYNEVYQNTVYFTPTSDTTAAAIKLVGVGAGNRFRNNLFYTTGGVTLLNSSSAYSTSSAIFQGNDWYGGGSTFGIKWGGTTYSDLSSWRGTGQEKSGTSSTGLSSNPQLASAGGGGTMGDAGKLHTLTAYQLLSSSPLINAGVALGLDAGAHDYYGFTLNYGGKADIGAFESSPSISGTGAADKITLRRGTTGAAELFLTSPATGTPTYTWAPGVFAAVTLLGQAGDDTLVLDLGNGNPLPSGGVTFDGGTHTAADGVQVLGSAGDDTLAVATASITPGGSGAPLKLANVNSIDVQSGSGNDTLQFNGVSGVAFTYTGGAGNDLFDVKSDSYTFTTDAGAATPNLAVTVEAGAAATFAASQHLRALTVNGTATLSAGGGRVIMTRALSVAGRLDLGDNDLIFEYAGSTSPLDAVSALVSSGRNGGPAGGDLWTGNGIITSLALNNPVGYTTLGVADATTALHITGSQTALFDGQTVDATCVLIKYTYGGDANLDGLLNVDDYTQIDSSVSVGGALKGWANGDFNYDGNVDIDDYDFVDSMLPIQGAPL